MVKQSAGIKHKDLKKRLKMIRSYVIVILIIILGIGGLLLLISGHDESVSHIIEVNYADDYGRIHVYPNDKDSDYLSESVGTYMVYLVKTQDEKNFSKQFETFKSNFLIRQDNNSHIPWILEKDSTVNALIDDVRIIYALQQASKQFDEPTYNSFAIELANTIERTQQVDDLYADFFDWSYNDQSSRMTLSYLTSDFFNVLTNTNKTKKILKNTPINDVFFPEYYDLNKHKYSNQNEVHMVDQLLIAINLNNIGINNGNFDTWLLETWDNGQLFGRYDRNSLQHTVSYESIAVYYYLYRYFNLINERELAQDVVLHTKRLAANLTNKNMHFFDFVHYQLMLTENDE